MEGLLFASIKFFLMNVRMISYIRLINVNLVVLLCCFKGTSCATETVNASPTQSTAILSQIFLSSITSGNLATRSQNIQTNGVTTELSSASTPTSSDSTSTPLSSESIILNHLSLSSSMFSSQLSLSAAPETASLSSSKTLSQPALSSSPSSTSSQSASLSSALSQSASSSSSSTLSQSASLSSDLSQSESSSSTLSQSASSSSSTLSQSASLSSDLSQSVSLSSSTLSQSSSSSSALSQSESSSSTLSQSASLSSDLSQSESSSSTLSQSASLSSDLSQSESSSSTLSQSVSLSSSTLSQSASSSSSTLSQSASLTSALSQSASLSTSSQPASLSSSSSTPTSNKEQSTPTSNKEQSTPTSIPPNSSFFTGSQSGWAAGPAIGGILGLTALFASAYIIGKEKRRRGNPLSRTATSSQSFNENPAFVSSDAESQPKPVRIQKFASYVDELHKDGDKKFHSQYQMLTKLTPHHEKSASELPQNRNKNRYANILPYDASRVKLNPSDVDQQATDYINASYIPGQTYQREYIAAQGPLSNTLADFWRMIWEQNVSCIVMLTSLKEDGKDKCAKYWPSTNDAQQDEFLSYGEVQVCLTSESVLTHYVIRILKVQMDEVCRTVRQYHFLDWTENRPPTDVESFLNFTRDVRAFSNRNAPVLVHCSSGSGRTGTFILVDRMLQLVDVDGKLDLFRTTLEMRNNRIFMVQTESQYVFAHNATKRAVNEKSFGASHHGFDGFDTLP